MSRVYRGKNVFYPTYLPANVPGAHRPYRSPCRRQREDLGRRGRQRVRRAHFQQWLHSQPLRTLQLSRRLDVVKLSLGVQWGISSIALIKTTGAASGTPLRNLRTLKRSQSPLTGPGEPMPRRVQQQKKRIDTINSSGKTCEFE